ncbi:hypothetical protein [Pseudophaeobacter sp.]|uniref:hypothetical protein n=1 Tax=Pseudophaeobacter sp. TaxID=1971739 RepID=UPI003299ACF1
MKSHHICATCKTPTMAFRERKMGVYSSIYCYSCNSCDSAVQLKPKASIGVDITVGGLALGFWWIILNHGSGSPSTIELAIMGIALLAYAWLWVPEAAKHWLYPAEENSDDVTDVSLPQEKGFNRAVGRFEVVGLLGGLLAPIVLIVAVLGVATIIGYINYSFFE